jgi:hypothetical protein
MGDYADDLINGSIGIESESDKIIPTIWVPSLYQVSVIHYKNRTVHWSGEIEAASKKDAQSIFRRDFNHIRSQYDPKEYGLGIKLKSLY